MVRGRRSAAKATGSGLLGNHDWIWRSIVFAQGVPQPVVEIVDRLSKVSFGSVGLQQLRVLEAVPEATGQPRAGTAGHEVALDDGENSDQRR
jgi:hypothetical protein